MVKPSVKREVVKYLKSTYEAGIGRMCSIVGWSRSTWYYESKIDDTQIIEQFTKLLETHSNRDFENYYYRIRREGYR